jgi:hypothetical protein
MDKITFYTCKPTYLSSIPRVVVGKLVLFEGKDNIWWSVSPENGTTKVYDKGLESVRQLFLSEKSE